MYFPDEGRLVPYPLQNNLSYLGKDIAAQALQEITHPPSGSVTTLADWLVRSFGSTLTRLFFGPFHELYTAGLWTSVVQDDTYKSPADLSLIVQGAVGPTQVVGYNPSFVYPVCGLSRLTARMARHCRIKCGKTAVRIDLKRKEIEFADGSGAHYGSLVSTIPLSRMVKLAKVAAEEEPGPWTSVLVLNIGATRGPRCPREHWIYVPYSKSGFYRVGFYSNVDSSFLPAGDTTRVSIYVERAFPAGKKPEETQVKAFCASTVQELCEWGFIRKAEIVHPNWTDVAYTYLLPGSEWRTRTINLFERNDVLMAGRYATWRFQGIADSMRDGLMAGTAIQPWSTGKGQRV